MNGRTYLSVSLRAYVVRSEFCGLNFLIFHFPNFQNLGLEVRWELIEDLFVGYVEERE